MLLAASPIGITKKSSKNSQTHFLEQVLVCFYAILLEHEHSISYQYIVRLEGMASGQLDDIWGEILLKLFLMRGFFLRQACSSHYLIVLLIHYLSTKKTWTNSETAMLSLFFLVDQIPVCGLFGEKQWFWLMGRWCSYDCPNLPPIVTLSVQPPNLPDHAK